MLLSILINKSGKTSSATFITTYRLKPIFILQEVIMLKIKRAYDKPESADGKRILIDRLWPRGVSKAEAGIDEWLKDLGPSTELRKWFGHDPEKWEEFRKRYIKELSASDKISLLNDIAHGAEHANVTLICSAKDTKHADVKVLEEIITKMMKIVHA
jgi:uncharacterized protein YeaO (DUF488 family)